MPSLRQDMLMHIVFPSDIRPYSVAALRICADTGATSRAGSENLTRSNMMITEGIAYTATMFRYSVEGGGTVTGYVSTLDVGEGVAGEIGGFVFWSAVLLRTVICLYLRALDPAHRNPSASAQAMETGNDDDIDDATGSIDCQAGDNAEENEGSTHNQLHPDVERHYFNISAGEEATMPAVAHTAIELSIQMQEDVRGAVGAFEEKLDIDIDIKLEIVNQAFQEEEVFRQKTLPENTNLGN